MQKIYRSFLIVSVACLSVVVSNAWAADPGMPGDGISDAIYDSVTGEFSFEPDGIDIGAFQMVSASGIFTGDVATLPAGLFQTDVDTEIGVGSFNAATSDPFSIGNVAPAGLEEAFLLSDLTTLRGSGGLGTPNRDFTLIWLGPDGTFPIASSLPADGGDISLQSAFDGRTGVLPDAIMVMNDVANSDPDLMITGFGADDGSIFGIVQGSDPFKFDLTIDLDAARMQPNGTEVEDIIRIQTNGGANADQELSYRVFATVPEPATAMLLSLAMVGLGLVYRR